MPKVQNPTDVTVADQTSVEKAEKKAKAQKAPKVTKEKAQKPAKPSKEKTPKEEPSRAMASTPAGDRKAALVKVLQKDKAFKASSAVPLNDLCTKLGYTRFDVYGLLRGTSGKADSNPRCLVAMGFVALTDDEEYGLSAYLTAKGQKTKFDCPPFVAGKKD